MDQSLTEGKGVSKVHKGWEEKEVSGPSRHNLGRRGGVREQAGSELLQE